MILDFGASTLAAYFLISTFIVCIAEILLSCIMSLTFYKYRPLTSISSTEVSIVNESELPTITILLALYKEYRTIYYLLRSITNSDYPADKLDIKLLIEHDDKFTLDAIMKVPSQVPVTEGLLFSEDGKIDRIKVWRNILIEIIHVNTGIKTKPNALNVGLARARGEVIAVYDAEDRPESSQLRKVASYMARHPDIGCVQARLLYYNADQSLLTKFFSIEFLQHYLLVMPFHSSIRNIIPLSGTSNFFRTDLLRKLNGWDPLNVTEDADLAIRLQQTGESVVLIESVTWEEAPPSIYDWIKQRTRWNKGYLYTLGVHFKRPRQLIASFGLRPVLFLLFTLLAPVISIISLAGWIFFALYWIDWFGIPVEPLASWIYTIFKSNPVLFYTSLVTFTFGLLYGIIMAFEGLFRQDDRTSLKKVKYAIIYPFYQMLQGISAVIAIIELFTRPNYWHKTYHGFSIKSDQI